MSDLIDGLPARLGVVGIYAVATALIAAATSSGEARQRRVGRPEEHSDQFGGAGGGPVSGSGQG